MQQVLSHQRHLHPLREAPGVAQIHLGVGRHAAVRQAADVAQPRIELMRVAEVHGRAQRRLLARRGSLELAGGLIVGRIAVARALHAKPGVGPLQAPPGGRVPVERQFRALRASRQRIRGLGSGGHVRHRAGEDRLLPQRHPRAQVAVVVVKGRRVERQAGRQLGAVAQFESGQLLGAQVHVRHDLLEHGQRARVEGRIRCESAEADRAVALGQGRRARSPRDGGPPGVGGGGRPQQPQVGLHFPAGVAVVLEFRAGDESPAFRHEFDLVVHEGTQELEGVRARSDAHNGAAGGGVGA